MQGCRLFATGIPQRQGNGKESVGTAGKFSKLQSRTAAGAVCGRRVYLAPIQHCVFSLQGSASFQRTLMSHSLLPGAT